MLLAFWVMSFSLVMTPGADWAYAISSGLRQRGLFPALTGMLAGYVAITLVVAAGVGVLITRIPGALTVMTLAGAAYLMWLGIGVLRNPSVPGDDGQSGELTRLRSVTRGFIISGGNPKALLLLLALLPQFTSPLGAWPVSVQILTLGLVQIINCGVVYTLVGLCSGLILRTRPQAARRVSQCSGTAMIIIAVVLLVEQLYPAVH